MDRPLEDVITERQRRSNRGGPGRRQNNWLRDDARKVLPPDLLFTSPATSLLSRNWRNLCSRRIDVPNTYSTAVLDWVHDKFDDDTHFAPRRPYRQPRNARVDRYSPEPDLSLAGARLRVDNLHYDLSEEDLEDLFTRIGPITSLSLKYDRSGRSAGTAFVTYQTVSSANRAIREFDGANAAGQPIRLTLLPTAPSVDMIRGRAAAPRNPFDTAVKPGRSLFDRIEAPSGRSRSRSPGAPRRTNVEKPPPDGVDRYVPPASGSRRRRSRTRSPRRRSPFSRTRSPIRGWGRGGVKGRDERERGPRTVNGRPRKTQDELDKEMEDYWNSKADVNGEILNGGQDDEAPTVTTAAAVEDDDIDMIS